MDPGSTPHPSLQGLALYPRAEIANLFSIESWQDEIAWQSFGNGVEIHRLYGDGISGPTAALIRIAKGGMVPRHEHAGYEHIIVLSGSQRDQNSLATTGSLVINPPSSEHAIVSEDGCIVLAIYEKPVSFVEPRSEPELS